MRRPWLGIVGLTLTAQIARYYGLPVDHGVLVTKVALGSPAEEAGMAQGDIILRVGDFETRRIEDLVNEIHKRNVGSMVQILAVRSDRERLFELQLSEAP
jgi:serine protease Do